MWFQRLRHERAINVQRLQSRDRQRDVPQHGADLGNLKRIKKRQGEHSPDGVEREYTVINVFNFGPGQTLGPFAGRPNNTVQRRAIWSQTLIWPGASTRKPHNSVIVQKNCRYSGYRPAMPSAAMAATRLPSTVALRMNSRDIMQGRAMPRNEQTIQIPTWSLKT